MKRSGYSWAGIFAITLFVTPVSAEIIFDGNYVQVRSELDAGPGTSAGSDTIVTDPVAADTGETSVVNNAYSASGRASASTTGGPDLRSISSSTAPDGAGLFPPSSWTLVRSSWRDVLLPTAPGAAASLDFNFSVHAVLDVSQTVPSGILGSSNFSQAGVSVSASDDIVGFETPTTGLSLSAVVRNLDGGVTETQVNDDGGLNWESAAFTSLGLNQYEFSGSFTYTAPLLTFIPAEPDAPFGAYFLGVGLSTQTSNVGGTSTADAFSTLTLDSITTADGSIISGDLYSFESGVPTNPIPIPATWLLMLSGIALGLTRLKRRRETPSS